jgi:RES domain-containing protein
LEARAWQGRAWRAHRRKYRADDPGGARLVTGRYHRGLDQFPPEHAFAALYLALNAETSLGEVLRHLRPELLPALNDYRLSELHVALSAVLDLRDPSRIGLTLDDLVNDHDVTIPQALGAAAQARGVEGLLVPSATRLGDNLVLFPANLHPGSRLVVVGARDPRLFVDR